MEPGKSHQRRLKFAISMVLALALVLAACGRSTEPDQTTETTLAGGATTIAEFDTTSVSSATDPSTDATNGGDEPASAFTLPGPELTELHIGNSGEYTANVMHLQYIQHMGLDEKYGFTDLKFSPFAGATQVTQALLADQIDLADMGASTVVASLATDAPLLEVFVTRHNMTDIMFTQPGVENADDLQGGSVAVSSFGTQSHAGALLSLRSLGLTPDDVTISQIGNDSARLAALQAGSVTASMNDGANEGPLNEAGFVTLVKLSEVEGVSGIPRTGLVVHRAFVDEYPNTVLSLVAMWMEANLGWREDPQLAAEILAEFAEIPLGEAQADIDAVLDEPWDPLDGRCNLDVMEFTREVAATANPALEDVDASEGCTNDFVDQLEDLGFQKSIGVPGY